METVFPANHYRPNSMGSLGDVRYMIIRQYNFPNTYDDNEKIVTTDHDKVLQSSYDRGKACLKSHGMRGELAMAEWFEKTSNDGDILSFIIEFINADKAVKWTGYRVMGSVHIGNGAPVWTLCLFSKNSKSSTVVYSGRKAPNVRNN